jgi:hypothetical protein
MAVIDAFSTEKTALHSVALKKMAKHGVKWHFSALRQYRAHFFTWEIPCSLTTQHANM